MHNFLERRLRRLMMQPVNGRSVAPGPELAIGSLKGPHRSENEDRAAVVQISFPGATRPQLRVGVVCDGMGGLEAGAAAASAAIAAFIVELLDPESPSVVASLRRAVRAANDKVYRELAGRAGTTLTALALSSDGSAFAAHVGDSRLYATKSAQSLELLSTDDTIQGALRQHSNDPDEDVLDNRLLQYVGIGPDLSPHLFPVDTSYNDLWFITSDGMHSLGRKVLEGIARNSSSVTDFVRKSCYVADAVGVQDNASVVAMSRDEWVEPENDAGLALQVWTPVDHLEVWLSDLSSVVPELQERIPAPAKTSQTLPPGKGKKRTSTGRKKNKPTDKQLKKEASGKATVPQLDIKFGRRD